MPAPEPRLSAVPSEYAERTPIGEVTVLVYAPKPGQTEVRMRFPYLQGPDAPQPQITESAFRELVMNELASAFRPSS